MISISEIKKLLLKTEGLTLKEIQYHLGVSSDELLHALEEWEDRGRIEKSIAPKCSGCNSSSCHEGAPEFIYRWI